MMFSTQALWWLALPVLLLPVWWHRQKRQRIKAEPLATARFLPAAPPQQLRVWRWEEVILLVLRCLLLVALIAWLAGVFMPWRGDTILVDPALAASESATAGPALRRESNFVSRTQQRNLDSRLRGGPAIRNDSFGANLMASTVDAASAAAGSAENNGVAWAEQQIVSAGFKDAQRLPLPADVLPWLQAHEHEWRPGARLLIVAAALPMPAEFPRLAHAVDIRLRPAAAMRPAGTTPGAVDTASTHHVALATTPERAPAWRALFSAFDAAGDCGQRYVLDEAPSAKTELIVWDAPGMPPPSWRAPLWWVSSNFAAPELATAKQVTIDGIALRIADSARGRIWASSVWPSADADAARALYETWQALSRLPVRYPAPELSMPAWRTAPLAMPDAPPAAWLAYALLILFALERLLTHARRR